VREKRSGFYYGDSNEDPAQMISLEIAFVKEFAGWVEGVSIHILLP
jgi:hypothetical protein